MSVTLPLDGNYCHLLVIHFLVRWEAEHAQLDRILQNQKKTTANFCTPTAIGNCRTIPSSPTEINVIFTMLNNAKRY